MKNYIEFVNEISSWEGLIMMCIEYSLKECKVFEGISDITKRLLILTNFKKQFYRLPFQSIFLDVELDLTEEKKAIGLLIHQQVESIETMRISHEDYCEYCVLDSQGKCVCPDKILLDESDSYNSDMEGMKFEVYLLLRDSQGKKKFSNLSFFRDLNGTFENFDELSINKKDEKIIRRFIANFLLFVNDPRIVLVEVKRGGKNIQNRIKHEKRPVPSSIKTVITNELKRYINVLEKSTNKNNYDFAFLVKGHFVRWVHPRYKKMQGKMTWIPPYVKGKGKPLRPQTWVCQSSEKWRLF